jgi:competence protein ComEC
LAVSLGAGVGLYFAAPAEPPLLLGILALVAAAFLLWRARRARLAAAASAFAAFAIALGFLAAEWRARQVAAPVLMRAYGPAIVEGIAREVVDEKSRARIVLDVEAIGDLAERDRPRRVRLVFQGERSDLRPGARIKVRARLLPPPGPAAPGAYDFAREAWFQGIGAVGVALGAPEISAADETGSFGARLHVAIERVRAAIGARIQAHLSGDVGALATALLNGNRAELSDDVNITFRASGLQHILSISGLHFAMVAFSIYGTLRLLLAAIEPVALRFPIKKWAAATALFGSFLYLLLSGAAIPAVRSFLMLAIVLLAVLLDRNALTMRNVAIAAMAILIVRPECLFNVSFQMSFAAVAALIAAFEARRSATHAFGVRELSLSARGLRYFGALALSSIVATAATAPFAVFHFHNFYGYGLPANMLGLPVLGFIVMPAGTLSLVLMPLGWEGPALAAMGFGIEIILAVARSVSHWPGAVVLLKAMPFTAFLFIVAGGLWITLWQTRWRRWGLAPIMLGSAIALLGEPPDLIVDGDASHVAVRGEDGNLVLLRGRATDFTGNTWLGRDADPRVRPFAGAPPRKGKPSGLTCDSLGCAYRMPRGQLLALTDSPASLEDDCARADIIVARVPARGACQKPELVIDRFALWRNGAHEVWITGGPITVRTVQETRGNRFWSPAKARPVTAQ